LSLTRTIKITAVAEHLREYSDSSQGQFAFGYTITIQNQGNTAVRLLNRYWIITNANGQQQTIQGKGVDIPVARCYLLPLVPCKAAIK
jgi:ApaG protein